MILAAGESKRLGRPKQLLPWGSTTLLNHVIAQVMQSRCERCVVVLGAHRHEIESTLPTRFSPKVVAVVNDRWKLGQSTSLQSGLDYIVQHEPTSNVLVAVCDQPSIPTDHYVCLIKTVVSPIVVAATAYKNGGGVPACFSSKVLRKIASHALDCGAKKWISSQPAQASRFLACSQALQDIDTMDAYIKLSQQPEFSLQTDDQSS